MKHLIAFSGKKRSGKDTAAKFLAAELDHVTVGYASFALPLKHDIARFLAIDLERLENNKARYRKLLQFWSQFAKELYGPGYWIQKLNTQLNAMYGTDVILVTDLRHANEAEYIKSRGGIIVRIERVGLASDDDHVTETEMDTYAGFDFVVQARTLVELNDGMKGVASKL